MHYIPKGSMCQVCVYVKDDCSKLDFKSMKAIEHYKGVSVIVRCTNFERKTKNGKDSNE